MFLLTIFHELLSHIIICKIASSNSLVSGILAPHRFVTDVPEMLKRLLFRGRWNIWCNRYRLDGKQDSEGATTGREPNLGVVMGTAGADQYNLIEHGFRNV